MNELVEAKVSEIQNSTSPAVQEIPFTFLERPTKKTTRLLANSGSSQPIDGRRREYKYSFKEPVFISHVVVHLDGYKDYDRFNWKIKTESGQENTFTDYPNGDSINVNIDDFCTALSFEPPSAWSRTTKLNQVQLFGFARAEASTFINFAYSIDELKEEATSEIRKLQAAAEARIQEADNKEAELENLQNQIASAKSDLAAIEKQTQAANQKLNELTSKSGAAAKQLEGTEERIANLRSEIKVETQKKEQVQRDVTDSEAKLKGLKEDINLFPSEISGFADQSGKNTRLYLNYSFGPIWILCSMFLLLISGAVDLTTVITSHPDVNLAAIIVSRMPYVAVASAIIYACYRLARLFITEVMNINRQRLSLTKISIIAKDISQSAETGLGFSDDQIYANRLKVKMALLSDHIKHLITTEPELLFPENLFSLPGSESRSIGRRRSKPTPPSSADNAKAE